MEKKKAVPLAKDKIVEGLNKQQKEAVLHTEGPTIIIAGAGSGKTRVITHRIAHLISQDVTPSSILSLTFTNKAAQEMKGRIIKMVGAKTAGLWMGTFHSTFSRILRIKAEFLGYETNFTIYDATDSRNQIKKIISEMGLDDKMYKHGFVANRISRCKNKLISSKEYPESIFAMDDEEKRRPMIGNIYEEYVHRCKRSNAMDFDDLLYNTFLLLTQYPDIAFEYQHKFKYIMVDEYQDTNHVQYKILNLLAGAFENICVVGDDAQSIYNFRGADIQNILNFEKDYPNCAKFKLERNYRSSKTIVESSNSIISTNSVQLPKKIFTERVKGEKIIFFQAETDNDEGFYVARKLKKIKDNLDLKYKNFAVFYRTNAQSRALEEAFLKSNVPYKIFGGKSFYDRMEIKNMMAYFKLVVNQKDEEALRRIINYPARGIGHTTLNKVFIRATEKKCALWEIISDFSDLKTFLTPNALNSIRKFVELIKALSYNIEETNAYLVAKRIADASGMLKLHFSEDTIESKNRYENVKELLNSIKEFSEERKKINENQTTTLLEFVSEISLITQIDTVEDSGDFVSLMTLHASKGLEFSHVFITGMEEQLFPSIMDSESIEEVEEERRLFYVGITRSMDSLHLTMAKMRFRFGKHVNNETSRFVHEIGEEFMLNDHEKNTRKSGLANNLTHYYSKFSKPKPTYSLLKKIKMETTHHISSKKEDQSLKIDHSQYFVGRKIKHELFGYGVINKLDIDDRNSRIDVTFEQGKKKTLLIRYLKLEFID